jgi:hypothetical protein
MIDWQRTAKAVVDEVHRSLPADADLKARQKALRSAWPGAFSVTSWGRKVRAKYTRAYLDKFGKKPLGSKSIENHLSPLERMIAKAKAASASTNVNGDEA